MRNLVDHFPIKGAFLWGDPDSDPWSKITRIVVHQRNRRIHSGHGFISSFDPPWSEWSWIPDPDLDHPKGTHPKITTILKQGTRFMLRWRIDLNNFYKFPIQFRGRDWIKRKSITFSIKGVADIFLPPFSLIRDFGKQKKPRKRFQNYQIGSKSTNHSLLAWRKEDQKVTLVAVIGGFRSDLSITRKTDGNYGNVSAGVLFSKVAYQRKRW